ncbi:hypothetical protein Vadar_001038 [Vaccinium darrowii]|uniref:Uncharacterized protein n=1 Tax=Vaccinium darrowii TaxID=229202 RepID=A0ACB7YB60_9ERIC|nr:hypothetical protein Vadar_001038 [Vaccinium darrowii]
MAKKTLQRKSSRFIRTGRLLIGGATVALLIFFIWLDFPKRPKNPILASDGVTTSYCSAGATAAYDHRHDPPNTTFYDNPKMSYSIDEPMEKWDEKRREWLESHPSFAGPDRVLLLTGSQPSPCLEDHLLLRLFKNKVDYCRINGGCDVFYSTALLHPKLRSYWAKLPLIRAAMLAHPEAEWIWWVDSDAVFTDMEFKLPLRRYKDHNIVVQLWDHLAYEKKSWVGLNAGVFLIRNCQWSMDFMQVWASMGQQSPEFHKKGRLKISSVSDKMFPASDDQSAMMYLLLKGEKKWREKLYVEKEYYFQGYWQDIVGTIETVKENYERMEKRVRFLRRRQAEKTVGSLAVVRERYLKAAGYGKGSWRRPFVTHFMACKQCNMGNNDPMYMGDSCSVGMEKALNFADNQVLRQYGFVRPDLTNPYNLSVLPFDFPAGGGED